MDYASVLGIQPEDPSSVQVIYLKRLVDLPEAEKGVSTQGTLLFSFSLADVAQRELDARIGAKRCIS